MRPCQREEGMSVSPFIVRLGAHGVPFISGLQSPLPNFQMLSPVCRRQGQGRQSGRGLEGKTEEWGT